jgi:hypothetical protein
LEYDVELHHIPGKKNGRADALSRHPDYNQGERDNKNITVLPESLFARTTQSQPQTLTYVAKDPPQQNEDILRPWVDSHKLKKINREWWKEKRKVVTSNDMVQKELIQDYHDLPAYRHPGIS